MYDAHGQLEIDMGSLLKLRSFLDMNMLSSLYPNGLSPTVNSVSFLDFFSLVC